MKKIENIADTYIEEYDVYIHPYLKYDDVQHIIQTMSSYDGYNDRMKICDLLILYYGTNLTQEQIDEVGHDKLYCSGLIDVVKKYINNIYMIFDGLEYHESFKRAFRDVTNKLPEFTEQLESVMQINDTSKE